MGVLAGDWQPAAYERGWGGYEEIELYGGQTELFGVRHVPAPTVLASGPLGPTGAAALPAGVVVCPPTWTDADVNAERELRLARRLASGGLVAQRFSYRGVGASGGSPGSAAFGSLVQDVRTTSQHLADRVGVERVGLVGTRVGALVAARVARDLPGVPLALWQPVLDPRQHVADAAKVAVTARPPMTESAGAPWAPLTPAGAGAGLPVTHPASAARALLGSRLGRDLLAPGVVPNLVDLLGPRPRPLLLVQLHRRVGLAPAYRDAVGRLEARGFTVDVAYDPTEEEWWEVHDGREPSDEAVDVTAEWLEKQLA
jgi:serine aminopeptidase S33 family